MQTRRATKASAGVNGSVPVVARGPASNAYVTRSKAAKSSDSDILGENVGCRCVCRRVALYLQEVHGNMHRDAEMRGPQIARCGSVVFASFAMGHVLRGATASN